MSSFPPPAPPSTRPSEPAPAPAGRDEEQPRWPLWTAPAAVAMGFVVGEILTAIVAVIGHVNGSSLTSPPPAVLLIGNLVFDLAFVGSAIYIAGRTRRPTPADFGYKRVPVGWAVGAVVAAGLSYYVLSDIYASLLHLNGSEKLPKELGVGNSTAALIGVGIFVIGVAPIAEEFFFRGFLFGVLRGWQIRLGGHELGPWVAAIITGILFGLAHTGSAPSKYLVPLGFLGFVLCLVRWRTGSLYPCMALHSLNNSLSLGINQLHWSAIGVIGLIVAGLVTIGIVTLPLASPRRPVAYG